MTQQEVRVKAYIGIDQKLIGEIDNLVAQHGLRCSGGSFVSYTDGRELTFLGFRSPKGTEVNYDEKKIANHLRRKMGFGKLVLDGREVK